MYSMCIQKFKLNTRRIFLFDGCGAVLSALQLGLILPFFAEFFGIPEYVLFCLTSIAITFAIYSLSCFFISIKNIRPFLAIIIAGNIMYCLVTTIILCFLYNSLTTFGVLYFVFEQLIIATVVAIEIFVFIELGKKNYL